MLLDLMQYSGVALGLAGAVLVSSGLAQRRRLGFALWLGSSRTSLSRSTVRHRDGGKEHVDICSGIPIALRDELDIIAKELRLSVGLIEMGAGLCLLQHGLTSDVRNDHGVVFRYLTSPDTMKWWMTGGGAAAGMTLGWLLGNIGVTAFGGAIGIPALVLAGGGAVLLASLVYTVGDLVGKYLIHKLPLWSDIVICGISRIGGSLLLEGAILVWKSMMKEGVPALARLQPCDNRRQTASSYLLRE